jgi:hypothetical protein
LTAPIFIPMVTVCRSPTDHEGTPRVETARFDHLTRVVSTVLSRRAVAGDLGHGALALPGLADAKKKCKKRKKTCTGGQ